MYQDLQLDDNPNYEDDLSAKPLYQRLWAGDAVHKTKDELRAMSKGRALFLGCNSFADHEIGRVLQKARKTAPDAMIIYTADHGCMMGNHRLEGKTPPATKKRPTFL